MHPYRINIHTMLITVCVYICDRICENVLNCRFDNYILVVVLSAYIILSIWHFVNIRYTSKRMQQTFHRGSDYLSLRVHRTLTLFQRLRCFSRENVARFVKLWRVCKKRRNTYSGASRTNPEANHKSAAHLLSKHGTLLIKIDAFFLTRTVFMNYGLF